MSTLLGWAIGIGLILMLVYFVLAIITAGLKMNNRASEEAKKLRDE